MSFIWPWMLLSLLSLPLFGWLYWRLLKKRRENQVDLGPLSLVKSQTGQSLGRQRHLPPLCFLLALTCLCLALARPEMLVDLPRVEGTVILAFDVSSSMLADDLAPSRIEAAKTAAKAFVETQPATIDIGVVAFGSGGLVVQTPTDDKTAILSTIDRLEPQGGTSLGQGIFNALNAIAGEAIPLNPDDVEAGQAALTLDDYSSGVILLLSDGENTEPPDPLEIAQLAAEAGVRIYAVGLGSVEGAVLEVDGFNVLTQLNEMTLQEIASLSNGNYYQAQSAERLREIYENVDLQLTIKGEPMEATALFAGLSGLLFLLGGMLSLIWFGRMP